MVLRTVTVTVTETVTRVLPGQKLFLLHCYSVTVSLSLYTIDPIGLSVKNINTNALCIDTSMSAFFVIHLEWDHLGIQCNTVTPYHTARSAPVTVAVTVADPTVTR